MPKPIWLLMLLQAEIQPVVDEVVAHPASTTIVMLISHMQQFLNTKFALIGNC